MTLRPFASGAYGGTLGAVGQVTGKGLPTLADTVTPITVTPIAYGTQVPYAGQPAVRRLFGQLWPRGDRSSS